MNKYLTATLTEKIWTLHGPEFGTDVEEKAPVTKVLYGLNAEGAAFRNHLVDCMDFLGYTPCKVDPGS